MKTKVIQLVILYAAGFGLSLTASAEMSQAALKAQAAITQKEATKTALARVPDGKIKAVEIEKENGKLVWSFDISKPKSSNIIEIQVDAKTGKIVSNQIETPREQAKEAVADKKEGKAGSPRKSR